MITKNSLVSQIPNAAPWSLQPYSGTDLSQVLGVAQVDIPDGHYAWVQTCGKCSLSVSGQERTAYVDFEPNAARFYPSEVIAKSTQDQCATLPAGPQDDDSLVRQRHERLTALPALLIEEGLYCELLREARDVFVDGHFYACVAMCGISLERFQRDKAKPHGARKKHTMKEVRQILEKKKVVAAGTIILCKNMADLRNEYAHGTGTKAKEDALTALAWMHEFIDKETDLMRDYFIVDGVLNRKRAENI